jgi:hypothetical protein
MTPIDFESRSLDAALDILQSRAAELSRPKLAALFASIGAGLLPLYVQFSDKEHWGNVAVLRAALDAAVGFPTGSLDVRGTTEGMLKSISANMPHESDFELPESTITIDAAVCIDEAVRACDSEQETALGLNTHWIRLLPRLVNWRPTTWI